MTDVKFMDLSQNDNPATTDSVLIGNSTDGLKRTTVGAIGNLFAVKGLLHFETVTVQATPDSTNPSAVLISPQIKAPNITGYNFAFWLNPTTVGDSYPSYIDVPNNEYATVYLPFSAARTTTTPVQIKATAVYVKSTVA